MEILLLLFLIALLGKGKSGSGGVTIVTPNQPPDPKTNIDWGTAIPKRRSA